MLNYQTITLHFKTMYEGYIIVMTLHLEYDPIDTLK